MIPEDEVNIVPQISGIIDEIFVEEGDEVVAGDLLAKIKVVPNEQALNSAEGRVKTSRIVLNNSTKEFERNKKLFDKGVISEQDFNSIELRYNQDQQNLENALNVLEGEIIEIKSNFLPREKGIRNAIFIEPKGSCPDIYPRSIGKAEKYPLKG